MKDTQDGEWTKKRRCAPEKGLVKQRTVMPENRGVHRETKAFLFSIYTEKQVEENNENNAFVWLNNCSKLYVKK